jgi:hypothetical protein
MTTPAFPPVDADLPDLLRALQRARAAGDTVALLHGSQALGESRVTATPTLMGALCLGGLDFASWLVLQQHRGWPAAEARLAVAELYTALLDPPAGIAAAAHESALALWLVDGFALDTPARLLPDLVRADILITDGPLTELPEAVAAAMRLQQWELALRGLVRMRDTLGGETPRNAHGWAAMCLHKLGRFDEAEQWVAQGLGEAAAQLTIPPVHTQEALLRCWGGATEPVVSIVCTAYNHERYIDSAIRGFLSQDCPYPFEILIHDDASTDRTQDIIRSWQQRYPAVIKPVLQRENQFSKGVRPFELLLKLARGAYVATCEGDDFWIDPAKLRRQVGFLIDHPEYSCSAHNYLHFFESTLTVKPWSTLGRDFVLSERQLMNVKLLLWLPTLVFRKTFDTLPPERERAAIGDQFLTSLLGTMGRCLYIETMLGAVRRENEFSIWSPLPQVEKERRRVRTWAALAQLHQRLGNHQAVADLMDKVAASRLDAAEKDGIVDAARAMRRQTLEAA